MDHLNDLSLDALKLLQEKLNTAFYMKRVEERRAAVAAQRAALAEVITEKNAVLVAAGKTRITAAHLASFKSWCRNYSREMEISAAFRVWFDAKLVAGLFRDKKVQPPKVKYEDLPIEERIRRLGNVAKHVNLRVVDLTAKVAAQTESLAAAEAAKQQLLIKEHTLQDIQVADYDIETAQYYLNKTKDLLERAKTSQRKFAERHC